MMQLAFGLLFALTVSPSLTDADVRAALDQPLEMTVNNQSLPEVFEQIAAKTQVGIYIAPEHLALLPKGPNTKLTLHIPNVPLKIGLREMLRPIGMTYRVANERIEIVPATGLSNIGRRASWNELNTLKWLSTTQWDGGQLVTRRIDKHLQFRVHDPRAATKLRDAMNHAGAGTVEDVLAIACTGYGWTWYPRNTEIIIENKTRHALDRLISIRAEQRRFSAVVAEFAQKADISISFEPGTLDRLPTEVRDHFSVIVRNADLRDGLDTITGAAGLKYRVEKDGVILYLPTTMARPNNHANTDENDPIVARIQLPDGRGEVIVRESQLDAETRALLQKLAQKLTETAGDDKPTEKP